MLLVLRYNSFFMENEVFVNKVAESGLITIDLAEYVVPADQIVVFDLKPFLFMELILKEKDFRQQLKDHDWSVYTDKVVAVTCSTDAIIPVWAYMLVSSYLQPVAKRVFFGNAEYAAHQMLIENIRNINAAQFADKRVVVKGCGEVHIPDAAYLEVTNLLRGQVLSIMYGEPCSTVPIFKRKASA